MTHAAVKARTVFAKGDAVVYTAASGAKYRALVLIAHRDASYTIRVQWSIRDDVLLMPFQGDKFRVDCSQVDARTSTGVLAHRLRHAS